MSSQEARAYAERYGYLLPSALETNAARDQAQLRGALPTYANQRPTLEQQRIHAAAQKGDLARLIQENPEVFLGGFTKIWAFNEGRNP